MFDERFARQYRFGLPPRFPLASAYTSKVHHLSGPFGSALTHTAHKRSPTVDAAGVNLGILNLLSFRVSVYHWHTRTNE
jgi:hypothetical protein